MPFIVFEGLDGAGKSTQVKLLTDYLTSKGKSYEYLHFPRFDAPVYGELVAKFLRGELGSLEQVNPYLVALIYAGDRKDASAMIQGWLSEGKFVLIDRYVYSNVGYQCAKAQGVERDQLKQWIIDLEYNYNKIPKPDLSLFLDVPFKFTENKLSNVREGDDRDYLKGADDIHESSLDLQQSVRSVYLDAAAKDADFKVVDCSNGGGEMDKPENIFQRILSYVKPLI